MLGKNSVELLKKTALFSNRFLIICINDLFDKNLFSLPSPSRVPFSTSNLIFNDNSLEHVNEFINFACVWPMMLT